jgi:hypothetical protein
MLMPISPSRSRTVTVQTATRTTYEIACVTVAARWRSTSSRSPFTLSSRRCIRPTARRATVSTISAPATTTAIRIPCDRSHSRPSGACEARSVITPDVTLSVGGRSTRE